jgi:hypothetical protein
VRGHGNGYLDLPPVGSSGNPQFPWRRARPDRDPCQDFTRGGVSVEIVDSADFAFRTILDWPQVLDSRMGLVAPCITVRGLVPWPTTTPDSRRPSGRCCGETKMIRKEVMLSLVLGTVLVASDAQAQMTGNDLYRFCGRTDQMCDAYVTAVLETWDIAIGGTVELDSIWCGEEAAKVTYEQAADIVTAFLRDHPEVRHRSAVSLVMKAISEKFPC